MLVLALPILNYGDDLDGGIPTTDTAINDDLQTGTNITFIKKMVKAKVNNGTAESKTSGGGIGNVNSLCTRNCTIVNSTDNKHAINAE